MTASEEQIIGEKVARTFLLSRTRVRHAFLLAAVLAAIGVVIALLDRDTVPNAGLVGTINLVLAAGVLAHAVYKARDRRPRLVLDHEGIWYRDWGIGKIAWPHVSDVYTGGSSLRAVVCVQLRDVEHLLDRLSHAERTGLRSNPLIRLPNLLIPDGALEGRFGDIAEAIRACLVSSRSPPEAGLRAVQTAAPE